MFVSKEIFSQCNELSVVAASCSSSSMGSEVRTSVLFYTLGVRWSALAQKTASAAAAIDVTAQ